jgi:acyl-CoA ligase (AMP-forming) (exosortase A-associated)
VTIRPPRPEWTLLDLLLNTIERRPGAEAVVDGDRSFTYERLLEEGSRLARALVEHGVGRGDRVAIHLDKSWEAVVAMAAVVQAGGVFVNVNPLLKAPQVRHIMDDCGVSAVIADDARLRAEGLPRHRLALRCGSGGDAPGADETLSVEEVVALGPGLAATTPSTECDLATIIYTSGSTGRPKGIMLTHHNVVAGAQIVSTYLDNTAADRVLSVLPLNFDVGMNQFTTMMRVGGTLVLQGSMMPGEILRQLREQGITGLAGVPSVWSLLLRARRSLEREPLADLRYITNTGGMIPQTQLDELRELLPGVDVYLMYGLTEAFRSTYLDPREVGRGSACIGRAIPNCDVWVVTADGTEARPGEPGELVHRGPTVSRGYWGDAERTSSVLRPSPFAPAETLGRDEVVYSGDVVRRDPEGFLHFVGRRDDQIKTQGYRVSPNEVEELLHDTGLVGEAAVFGRADEALGQRIVAVVAPRDGVPMTAEELRARVAVDAPSHLVPQEIHILGELPKNANGKVDRRRLRHEYAS